VNPNAFFAMKHPLILLTLLSFAPVMPASAGDIVALCIGNDAYVTQEDVLDTPVNDARLMHTTLRAVPGVVAEDIVLVENAKRSEITLALRQLKARAPGAKLVLIFYSGHGVEDTPTGYDRAETFLLPVDAVIESADDLPDKAVPLKTVLEALEGTRGAARGVILDCCRSGAPGATKSLARAGKNLAALDESVKKALGGAILPEGTLIAFAASPGRKAAAFLQDTDTNSPFTRFITEQMSTQGGDLFAIVNAASRITKQRTEMRQVPHVELRGDASLITDYPIPAAQPAATNSSSGPLMTLRNMKPTDDGNDQASENNKSSLSGRKMAIVAPAQRFNMDDSELAARAFGDKDRLIFGVKNWVAFDRLLKSGREPFMDVKIAGIEAPAQLAFIGVPPSYPLVLGLRFPTLHRTCPLPESFYEGVKDLLGDFDELAERWVLNASMYDFDNDGVPELIFAANKRNGEQTSWDIDMVLRCMVFSFRVPAASTDLDDSSNWSLCGTVTGQFVVDVDGDRLILPIGSQTGDDYQVKNGVLLKGQGIGRDLSGRWWPSEFDTEAAPKTLPSSARVDTVLLSPATSTGSQNDIARRVSFDKADGTWRVVEKVRPEKGGYEIVWDYTATLSEGAILFEGRKVLVNNKTPTKGEAEARSRIKVLAGSINFEGEVDEVNHKGDHLKSTMKLFFNPSFQAFSAQNFEDGVMVSELTGTKTK
jgi:hypothetical protein